MPRRKLPSDPQLLKDFLEHPEWTDRRFADFYGVVANQVGSRRRLIMARFGNQIRGVAGLSDEEFAARLEACQFDRFAGRLP